MELLNPGDKVEVRVKNAIIVSPYKGYDEKKIFEIVAVDEQGCYLFIPVYELIKGSIVADSSRCRKLGIELRFLDEQICYIQDNRICRIVSTLDGIACANCKEFHPMAEPNREGGETFICYSCRTNPYI